MRHFLAYGNSDQVSFRDNDVRNSFDYVTVPGTIAAYYEEATAAFVLSSGLEYVIDPRTPLFQGRIDEPKASHYSLASWHGPHVVERMGDPNVRASVTFDPQTFAGRVIEDMVHTVMESQRNYGNRASQVETKYQRYSRLLQEAQAGREFQESRPVERAPAFLLAPYFCFSSFSDPWWEVNVAIWQACERVRDSAETSCVIAVDDSGLLAPVLSQVPGGLSRISFFWVNKLDERSASESELRRLTDAVAEASDSHDLVNLYGGFFSICLHKIGLWGFNNGLGYSESRSWPELPITGAAPARYYLPGLHMYLSPTVAQQLIDIDPSLACDCAVCFADGQRISIAALGRQYHQLKRHFALTRQWELNFVRDTDLAGIVDHLEESAQRATALRGNLPSGTRFDASFLDRWSRVLRQI